MLVSIDVRTGAIELVKRLEFSEELPGHLTIGRDDELFIVSAHGKDCLRYRLSDGNTEHLRIPLEPDNEDAGFRFKGTLLYEDRLLMFPGYINELVCMDIKKSSFVIYNLVFKEIDNILGRHPYCYFGAGICTDNTVVYLPGFEGNCFASLNMSTMDCRIHVLENEPEEYGFREIKLGREELFMVNRKQHILKYDKRTLKCKGKVEKGDIKEFTGVLPCENGFVWIPDFLERPFIIWEEETGALKKIEYPEHFACFMDYSPREQGMLIAESKEEYYFYPHLSNMLLCIDKKNGKIRFLDLHYGYSILQFIQGRNKYAFEEKKEDVWHPTHDGIIYEFSYNDFLNALQ